MEIILKEDIIGLGYKNDMVATILFQQVRV